MSPHDLRQIVSQCEGLLDGLARSADREAVYGTRSHLIPRAERGKQCRGNVRYPKQPAVVFPVRRHNRSPKSSEVAKAGVTEETGSDYPRLTQRPALIDLG